MVVELDPQLLEILACPSPDHAPLIIGTPSDVDAAVLTCTSCGRQYPVVDGVPVLLLDEAVLGADADVRPPGGPPVDGTPSEK